MDVSDVELAELSDAESLPISTVLMGIKVIPNVELAEQRDVCCDDRIVVNASGRTSDPDNCAAGDVTNHPN